MALPITLLLFNILIFMMAMVVMTWAAPSRRLPPIKWLLVLVFSFCVVSFCTLGVYVSKNFETQVFFSRMRFLTLGLMSPSWLLFLSTVFDRWKWLHKNWVSWLVLLPGLVTTILTIIPGTQDLVANSYSAFTIANFDVVHYQLGTWFQFHYLSAMTLVAMSVVLGIYIFCKESGIRRLQVVILTLASTLAAGVDIYCVLTNSPYRWLMLASGTFLFSLLGIIFTVQRLELLNIVPLGLARVFQDFPDPVLIVDNENVIRAVNKVVNQFFGLDRPVGKKMAEILPHLVIKSGEVSLFDTKGESHFFNLTIENLATDSGIVSGKILFFRHITVQKSIEMRLSENLEFKARLLALIAHDLSGQIENQTLLSLSLQDEIQGEPLKERMELLTKSTIASQGFVSNMMSWIKSQETEFSPVRKNFEWNLLVRECIEDLEALWKMKKIEIMFESIEWPLLAEGDSDMMAAVIRNLLSNSIRATSDGKRISVYLYRSAKNVEVSIVDEGCGMNPELLSSVRMEIGKSIFGKNVKSEFRSYGIGLVIVKQFVALHGGELSIDSELGVGTTVSFYVPLR